MVTSAGGDGVAQLAMSAVQLYARWNTLEGDNSDELPDLLCPVLTLLMSRGADEAICRILVAGVESGSREVDSLFLSLNFLFI